VPLLQVLGIALEVFSAASVAAAVVFFVLRIIKPSGPAELPQKARWFLGSNLRAFTLAVFAALLSRVLLAAVAYGALAFVQSYGSPEIKGLIDNHGFGASLPQLSAFFSRWDAPHYLDIARFGYTSSLSVNGGEQHWFIVFYPLYPALTALLKPIFGNEFNAATVLSWACLAGACYWIYRLSLLDNDRKEARRAVKYLLIFPAAVFLGAPYTESLFLLLSALCLYDLRKRRWWLAGVTAFFAALTRNLGALLAVPFLAEAAESAGLFADWKIIKTWRFWRAFLSRASWALLIPLAIGVYLLINQVVYGDPLAFLRIQSEHWYQHAQPFFSTVLMTWTNLTASWSSGDREFLWLPQMIGMAAMFVCLPFMARRLRPSYAAYLVVYLIAALTPSWLLSFNRYMMGAVPLFLGIAALTRRKWVDRALTILFVAAMLYLAAGFFMWKGVY
jgi:hypothetical protein